MIKRTIDISDGPTHLRIENDQLLLERAEGTVASIPAEDIGVLLIDHPATTYTHSALTRLLDHGAVVVLCGPKHLPVGILLSTADNLITPARLRTQAAAPLPLRKRLWKQIVTEKIRLQAANLEHDPAAKKRLLSFADNVRSGDTSNTEGVAARFYWQSVFPQPFRRDPDGLPPNDLLNYGYTIFRAAIARALVAAGLHPAFGLHHHNRNNNFALADDLVEVFRARVDATVRDLIRAGVTGIDRDAKRQILGLLTLRITVAGQDGPLMVQLHRMATSLVRCYDGQAKQLDLPSFSIQSSQTEPLFPQSDDLPEELSSNRKEDGA